MITLADLHPDDEVILTGTATSPPRRYVNLHAVVATVSPAPGSPSLAPLAGASCPLGSPGSQGAVKVWPLDEDGKVWFPWDQIEEVRRIL
jgi:hypothetical protein